MSNSATECPVCPSRLELRARPEAGHNHVWYSLSCMLACLGHPGTVCGSTGHHLYTQPRVHSVYGQ